MKPIVHEAVSFYAHHVANSKKRAESMRAAKEFKAGEIRKGMRALNVAECEVAFKILEQHYNATIHQANHYNEQIQNCDSKLNQLNNLALEMGE
jgi:hypothetical protein